MTEFKSQAARFLEMAEKMDEAPAYARRGADAWEHTSWQETALQAQNAASKLLDLGISRGDRICIISFNRPEWLISYLGALLIGAIPVGIYWTASAKDIQYIINHAEAKLVFAENAEQAAKVEQIAGDCPTLAHKVVYDEPPALDAYTSWREFLSPTVKKYGADIKAAIASIEPEDCGTLIYTSGTTGPPKAVFLSQRALVSAAGAVAYMFKPTPDDRLISYLPMAHIAEQNGMIHQWIQVGFATYFASSIEDVPTHLPEVRPTVYFGVPRVFEKMVAALSERLEAASPLQQKILTWAMAAGKQGHLAKVDGRSLSSFEKIQFALAEKLILAKVRKRIGLDAARLFVCGAAPVSMEVLETCASLGIVISEVYGQSETGGPTTLNIPGQTKLGSVGKTPPTITVKIAEDGEILVKGENVFSGYDKDPDATNETLINGWLHSGDIGRLDDEGYLYITGRKKDLIITSGGKNISPAYIEADLMDAPIIEHAVVCGDKRHYLVALITVDAASPLLSDLDATEIREKVQAIIDDVNASHSRVENIRKFTILDNAFTPETGELTSTLKVRRHTVIDKYATEIEALYAENADA